jgi:anti-sigma regulatory factor (Ser/Thr protein kinase)
MRDKKYWICQAIGWGLFALINVFFGALYSRLSSDFAIRLVVFCGTGFLFSHLTRILIKKTNILQKSFIQQIIRSVIIIIFFAALSGIVIFGLNKYFNVANAMERQFSAIKIILGNSFSTSLLFGIWSCLYFLYHYVQGIRREEQQKIEAQKNLLELEAKALRAQMNPHFIFNCLNSIKSLIQEDKKEVSVTYLTTFSKLIRTLFNNADKKEINLYDEIETCKLYLKLESMRFDAKFSYGVTVDPDLDLKSIQVPALIIQPFIENAIMHGIMPKDTGGHLEVSVLRNDNSIDIIIEDNGIGREASVQNKSLIGLVHQSKGVYLTQSRLALDNLITKRQAALKIVDKKNENGTAQGTKAILTFIYQLL